MTRKYTEEQREKDRIRQKRYREKHPLAASIKYKKWRLANPEKANSPKRRQQSLEWSAARPWKRREYKFGLSQEAFDAILQTQNFGCAACKTDLRTIVSKNVHVDHCHVAGRVRGILCHACNTSLGLMKEDVEKLKGLISYIEGF